MLLFLCSYNVPCPHICVNTKKVMFSHIPNPNDKILRFFHILNKYLVRGIKTLTVIMKHMAAEIFALLIYMIFFRAMPYIDGYLENDL